jgi:hypothetical protein
MTRSHRAAHRLLWILLALVLGLGLAAALLWRAPAHAATPASVIEAPR